MKQPETHHECTGPGCGHHYTVLVNPGAPYSEKCPLCGSPGRPELAVDGWCKGETGGADL
jgi:hypothetical protein